MLMFLRRSCWGTCKTLSYEKPFLMYPDTLHSSLHPYVHFCHMRHSAQHLNKTAQIQYVSTSCQTRLFWYMLLVLAARKKMNRTPYLSVCTFITSLIMLFASYAVHKLKSVLHRTTTSIRFIINTLWISCVHVCVFRALIDFLSFRYQNLRATQARLMKLYAVLRPINTICCRTSLNQSSFA